MHYQKRSPNLGLWQVWKKFRNRIIHSAFWQKAIALLLVGLCVFTLAACEPIPEPNQVSVGSVNRLKNVLSRGKLVCEESLWLRLNLHLHSLSG